MKVSAMFAHNISIRPVGKTITLRVQDTIIVKTERALELREPPLVPVYYVPRDDVFMEHLQPSKHKTNCPFKGEASYYHVKIGEDIFENAAWCYDSPPDEVAEIKGFIAFYDSVVQADDI